MKEIISFLNKIQENNNRPWFLEHKAEFLEQQSRFNAFAEKLITEVGKFDESTQYLTLKQCTYRFYRDLRFSPDKRPYKNHFGVYICPGGKKSGFAGYYFHVEADFGDYIGNNILSCGAYMPDKKETASIRDDIHVNGEAYKKAIVKAKGFSVEHNSKLLHLPNGFPKDTPYPELVKLKDFSLWQTLPPEILFGDHLLEYVVDNFNRCYDFNQLLNKAIAYSHEPDFEMPEYLPL